VPPSDSALARQQEIAEHAAIKLSIEAEGWYRVTAAQLAAAGLPSVVNPRTLQLFGDGEEQPIVVASARPDRFDAGDAIEFYATGVDTPYTATRVYWLTTGRAAGLRVGRVMAPAPVGMPARSFPFTVEVKDRSIFFAALINGESENFFGALITPDAADVTIMLPHVDASAASPARLEVTLQGVTATPSAAPNHHVAVLVNGESVGTVEFDGQEHPTRTFAVPSAQLVEGANIVTLAALGDESDVSLVDTLRLTYAHTYTADANRLRLVTTGQQPVTLGGFSRAAIRVFDITDPRSVVEVIGRVSASSGGYQVSVCAPGHGVRTLLAVADTNVWTPTSVRANTPSSWHEAGRSADYVLITPAEFATALGPLKALRMSQGHTVAVIDIEDLYDEFSFGQKTPYAMRDFLIRAKAAWARAPKFVTLVGNATTDPRNYLGTDEVDWVPTKLVATKVLETASDDWFADADGDGLAELAAIGRLPARTRMQAADMAAKIVAYEQAPDGAWSKDVTLVADTTDEGGPDFEATTIGVQTLLPQDRVVTDVFRGAAGTAAAHAQLLAQINAGQEIVNYAGHGSVQLWRDDLFTTDDVVTLTNGVKLPLFVVMDCLNGFFHSLYPEESLAEALMRASGGGAIAVWASSGVTGDVPQAQMNRAFYRLLFGGAVASVGEAIVQAKRATSDLDVRRTWIFFGDPATRLKGMPTAAQPSHSPSAIVRATTSPSSSVPRVPTVSSSSSSDATTPRAWPTVHLLDWNGDGRADVFLSSAHAWHEIDAATDRGPRGSWWDAAGEQYPANLNGDGLADLLLFDRESGTWAQAINTGAGGFRYTSGVWGGEWTVHVGDLNGDGVDDVLLTDPQTGLWFTGLNDRHGGFTYRSGQWAPGATVTLGDFTGDGRVDAFVYDATRGGWTLAVSDGAGAFTSIAGQWLPGWTLQTINANGDARADLLLYNPATGAWAEATSADGGLFIARGGMWAPDLTVLVLQGRRPGRDDLVFYSATTGQWTLLAHRAMVATVTSGVWIPGLMLASGDLDGDGRTDLVVYDPMTGWSGRALRPEPQRFEYQSSQWEPGWTILGRP
jgi:hypothetical protein